MVISKQDAIMEAIAAGRTNDEIRDQIDGRLRDKTIDALRNNPLVRGGGSEMKRQTEPDLAQLAAAIVGGDAEKPEEIAPPCETIPDPIPAPRMIAAAYTGEATNYRVDVDGVWLGQAGEMTFIPGEMIEQFTLELGFILGEYDKLKKLEG